MTTLTMETHVNTKRLILIPILIALLTACQTEVSDPPGTQPGPVAPASEDPREAIDAVGLMEKITVLSADEFGGRAPMSEGERLTLDFLEKEFKSMGLDPLFGDQYRQAVPLVAIEAQGKLDLAISNSAGDPVLSFQNGPESAVWTKHMVDEVTLDGSELVWAGFGIVAPEFGWDDYAGIDVSGKTVIVLVNDPGFATQDQELFNGNAMTYYGRWTYKYEEAARQGAAGLLIVHQTDAAGYGWNVIEDGRRGPQFDLAKANRNLDRVRVEGWLQYEAAERLLGAAGLDLDSLASTAAQGSEGSVALGLNVSVRIANRLEYAESYNIGAIRRGSQRPEELFLYTAHWDHMGTTAHEPGAEGDFIYNGAQDNASGTSGMLEIAEAWARAPAPQRSVGFLAVTAEESGLLGSKAYADAPAVPMTHTVAGLNMDGLNFIGPMNDVVVVGFGSSEMEDVLSEVAQRTGRSLTPEDTPEKGYYYRSDHFNFAKKGVPFLYASGGTTHRTLGAEYVREKRADYVSHRYHSPADEIQDDWDLDAAMEDLILFYDIGDRVANSEDWPEWYPGNEFRSIREASRNQ